MESTLVPPLLTVAPRSLAAAFVTVRALIRAARQRFRWPGRPTTRRLP